MTAKELEELAKKHKPDDIVYFEAPSILYEDGYITWEPEAKDFKFKARID